MMKPCSKWVRTSAARAVSPVLPGLAVMCWRVRQRPVSRANPHSPGQRWDRWMALRVRVLTSSSRPARFARVSARLSRSGWDKARLSEPGAAAGDVHPGAGGPAILDPLARWDQAGHALVAQVPVTRRGGRQR